METFLGVEVRAAETVEAVAEIVGVVAAKVVEVVRARAVKVVIGGPTSRKVLTTHHHQSVKNIICTGNRLTGVRNQPHALGRTSGSLRVSNETSTSLILVTFKTFYITTSIGKYTLLLI